MNRFILETYMALPRSRIKGYLEHELAAVFAKTTPPNNGIKTETWSDVDLSKRSLTTIEF